MKIGPFDISKKVLIVAEVGNNHEGNVENAKRMISLAAKAGADAVKFQTFKTELFVSPSDTARVARLKSFELTFDQFRDLSRTAADAGIMFLSTPLDMESARFLNEIVPAFKIASGDNNFYPLIKEIAGFGKPVILSRGLADFEELRRAVSFIESVKADPQLALLHCVTRYPVEPHEANLAAILQMQKEFSYPIGYSDHVVGIEASVIAATLGSRIIEKHFTIDKNFSSFRDHALSADPGEMAQMVLRIRGAELSGMADVQESEKKLLLGSGTTGMQESERSMVPLVRRSIAARKELAQGSVVNMEDLTWLRPSGGLNPGQENLVIGKKLKRTVKFGEAITLDMVE
jgi:N,N'-diacetyllegionaminate synthase